MPALTATRRLPGIRFETTAPAPDEVLPRMDIAAFVGFAARGPVDVPVVVQDASQFAEIFGDDAELFWDEGAGESVSAYLAPAVRAFFRNGGKRCWVVRVTARTRVPAGSRQPGGAAFCSSGSRARFAVPGVVLVAPDGSLDQAELGARAVGSWADGLRVAAGLLSSPVHLVAGSLVWNGPTGGAPPGSTPEPGSLHCTVGAQDRVRPGDLIRITYRRLQVQLLFAVASVEVGAPTSPPSVPAAANATAQVVGTDLLWLEPALLGSPPVVALTGIAHIPGAGEIRALLGGQVDGEPGSVVITLGLPVASAPQPGTAIRLTVGGDALLLVIDDVRAGTPETLLPAGSPPGSGGANPETTLLSGRAIRGSLTAPHGLAAPEPGDPAEVLSVELRCQVLGEDRLLVLTDLGFHPLHARYAGNLPTDEELYGASALTQDPHTAPSPRLWSDAATPRFPLAGIRKRGGGRLYPISAKPLDGRTFVPPVADPRRALQRDGLDAFGAGLFLDPELVSCGTTTLSETADFLQYRSGDPRPLVGIHALLQVDEVTLAAVPDAVHRAWRASDLPPTPAPPAHEHFSEAVECRQVAFPPSTQEGSPPGAPGPGRPVVVRAGSDFEQCRVAFLSSPILRVEQDMHSLGNIRLAWDPTEGAEAYVLQQSADPSSWRSAAEVYRGPNTAADLFGRSPGAYFYRVRTIGAGASSDWSNGVAAGVLAGEPWNRDSAGPAYSDAGLLAVHRCLIRMCAARGDMVALLSVPRHYREQETVDHATRVRAGQSARPGAPGVEVPPLGGEERSLSFGALYHPWPVAARASLPEDLRAIPPDGHAAGVLARRALLRGAWIAPANESLVGVLDLAPPIAPASWQRLQDGRVNTVRQESRGFLWLSADTLSDDPDLRELGVRRLLSLVRRVCLRYGPTFVFEPNDDGFRRRIRHNLERILNEMLERGAFAGVTPGESYRVETLDPPNSPQTVEQGRLIVELKVAPSLPMRFLTVRLIHSGDLGISVEGA
ncbi:MAG: hypothetical protein QOH66_1548 [Actinomycetota bacterium]|nr:hypothetical protein [Actinomycetota bacterium]